MFISQFKCLFFLGFVMSEVELDIKNGAIIWVCACLRQLLVKLIYMPISGFLFSVVDGHIIITPVFDEPLTLEQQLAHYDQDRYCNHYAQTGRGTMVKTNCPS